LDVSQQNVINLLKTEFVEPAYEVSTPDEKTLIRTPAGKISPYIAFQFGDLQDGYSETFGGAETNDFWLPIYVQVVASEAEVARKLSNKLVRVLLGYRETYGGQIRKRLGGGMFPIQSMDGTVEAYVAPASFGVKIQLFTDV